MKKEVREYYFMLDCIVKQSRTSPHSSFRRKSPTPVPENMAGMNGMDYSTDPNDVCRQTGERGCVSQDMGEANVCSVCHAACPLTRRERDVLLCMFDGKTDKQIAATLMLSRKTVQHHVGSLLAKLKAKNRTQAVVQALLKGLVDVRSITKT